MKTEQFLKSGSLFCEDATMVYEMSREKSIDVDTMEDIVLIEKRLADVG